MSRRLARKSESLRSAGARRGLLAVVLVAALVPSFAAFEAHNINVRAHIENAIDVDPAEIDFGVVFPQERLSREFGVSLSESFRAQTRVTDVFYRLLITRKPLIHGDTSTVEDDLYPDLRPYAQVVKVSEPDTDTVAFGDLGNDWWITPGDPASGSGRDLTDRWRVDLAVPCIAGSVGADYAGMIAPAEDDYGMDVRVEVLGFSYGRRIHKIPVGPRVVTTGIRAEWTFYFVVKNTSEEIMRDVELTDRFGAELESSDLYDVSYVYGSPEWTFEQFTNNAGTQDRFRWWIDELAPLERGLLVLTVTTKVNPAGKQEYTHPGTYTMNSGAVLKWTDSTGGHSEATEPIEVTAVGP